MSFFNWILSFIAPVHIRSYNSALSGPLFICLENGRKVLNTEKVNYSYNSLHRVFRNSFKQTGLNTAALNNCLLLGLGGGSIVEILRKNYQYGSNIDCIELDPVILEIARKEFFIDKSAPIRLINQDAYEYVSGTNEVYDLICVDLFVNDTVPEKFTSPSFIKHLLGICSSPGIIYFNTMNREACFALKKEIEHHHPGIAGIQVLNPEETNFVLVIRK